MKKYARNLFMTGTALENKKEELIELIKMLNPNLANEISSEFDSPLDFKKKLMPVYYRRKREDVLNELPELVENFEWCELGAEEKQIYQKNVLSKNYMIILE